ncbi:hybrid sensor histidine kinase/response regulator [Crocosphaera sp.]|uniref:hybrid sensor histidine kinase/response regulator n=1 Tax=Crocosphaera sp. TaxID=2729996 RepID=UPI003F2484CC|nr:response regulator [Crocosphaera sp.]
MKFTLDDSILATMTQEARQCFLEEDAPEYLSILKTEIVKGYEKANFTELLRAAHSLKGGAGIAQLSSIMELSHGFEDVLEILQKQPKSNQQEGWILLELVVHEITLLLHDAQGQEEIFADANLLKTLADFAASYSSKNSETITEKNSQESSSLQLVFQRELDSCFSTIEQVSSENLPDNIQTILTDFYDQCLLLGETLDLPWLLEKIEPLNTLFNDAHTEDLLAIIKPLKVELQKEADAFFLPHLEPDINKSLDGIEMISSSQTMNLNLLPNEVENNSKIESFFSNSQEDSLSLSTLRIPLERLEVMTNEVGELLVTRERLRLRQQQLSQVTRKIRDISRQLEPIQDKVQSFYNQLAITPLTISSDSNQEFDSLELDQYTEIHSSLQTFQELMLQFQENYADLNLINQDFSDNLDIFDTNIDALYSNVTKSRLVPFKTIAKRFLPQIQSLNNRYDKFVNLSLQGEDILVDKILLEQLQTPLSHLINNALSHGIESPSERLYHQKSQWANIQLSARIDHHQLQITVKDDGQGIDLYKVYQKAKNKGLISSKLTFDQLSPESILEWIFHPNFSTVETASELSGRGFGLDIVRNKIQKLRGTIEVKSEAQKGTTFTLNIPLNLNFMSLFLIQWQHRLFALPTCSVLETISVSELLWENKECTTIKWRDQSIPNLHLSELLSEKNTFDSSIKSQVGIILEGASHPFLVMVDTLVSEEQLLVKSFDETVIVPDYLLGCTILGGGEIVPVILPRAFRILSETKPSLLADEPREQSINNYGTILVAEDSVATRRLLEKILEKVGFNVILCRDGQEALEKLDLHQGGIDLIISDIEMPRINGFELLQKIRSQPNYSQIPIIMSTSRTGQHHRQRGTELGANAYLGKPILAKTLLKTIESFLTFEPDN